jgi:TolB-like protein/DNA-binding winged helix-turn-helix (wHTH) protein
MERLQSDVLGAACRLGIAGFVLDLAHRELLDGEGRQVVLRKQALDVLLVLADQVGHVVTKGELLRRVWPDVIVTEDSLVQAITDIRHVLGDRSHTLVRTVPRRGYLLAGSTGERSATASAASVAGLAPTGATAVVATSVSPPVAAAASRWRWAGGALLAFAALGWAWMQLRGTPPVPGPPQIAVLAFHERGHGVEAASLGAGLSEDLVMELGRNQGLNVVANHSSFAVSGKGLSTAELGRRLHAQYLIDGVVQREGERLDMEVELIDVRADKVLWASRQQTEGGEVVHARDEIVRKVAGTILSKMRESEKQRVVGTLPASLDVYALTQRSLALKHQFTPEAIREARAGLERALAADPRYATAWWVLGWVNTVDAWFALTGEWNPARLPEAVAQIKRGIELDPYSSSAHVALSTAMVEREAALAAASRAVELAPGNAEAWLFEAATMLPLRSPQEALASVERAMEMDPIPPTFFHDIHARVLWANGRWDDALREAQVCSRTLPLVSDCRFTQLLALAQKGDIGGAREHLDILKRAAFTADRGCSGYRGSAANESLCRRLAAAVGLPE